MDRTESTEQHPNDGQVIITSSHMQTGISCLQTETKLWACNHSEKACSRHDVQGWNNPIKSERAVNTTHLHRTAMLSSLQYKICYYGWERLARAGVRQGESMNSLTTDGKYWKNKMLFYWHYKPWVSYIFPLNLFWSTNQCNLESQLRVPHNVESMSGSHSSIPMKGGTCAKTPEVSISLPTLLSNKAKISGFCRLFGFFIYHAIIIIK